MELLYPLYRLREEDAAVTVAGLDDHPVTGKKGHGPVAVDTTVDRVAASDFDALVIPGGYAPDKLRRSQAVLDLVRAFDEAGKPIAFICHAGWVPISAKILKGRRATSVAAIRDDMVNAGTDWVDQATVVDGNLISARTPADLGPWMKALLTALGDGLFAVAMTLLVLDLRVPVSAAGVAYSEHGLAAALLKLGPNFAAYLLSFTMLGTFWLAQHTLLGIFGRCDRTLTWINLGFLFVVSLLPFSAALLAHYVHLRLAVGVYWLNILLLGTGLEWAARYGRKAFVSGDDGQARSRLTTFRL